VTLRAAAVSVLLPLRIPAPWLQATMYGLRSQTHQNWELVCTVPTDSLTLAQEVLAFFPDAIILHVSDALPFPDVLNAGLDACSAELIARIDQDDIALDDRLMEQSAYLEAHPEVAVVTSPVRLISPSGLTNRVSFASKRVDVRRCLLFRNCVAHPAVMMRRSLLPHGPVYSTSALHGEDYDLWLRIASKSPIHCLARALTFYRIHAGQMSHNNAMNREGRSRIVQGQRDLAKSLGISSSMLFPSQAAWVGVQMLREMRRTRGRTRSGGTRADHEISDRDDATFPNHKE
jgi:glycosyltransferase involved in cell wall biosynthesis